MALPVLVKVGVLAAITGAGGTLIYKAATGKGKPFFLPTKGKPPGILPIGKGVPPAPPGVPSHSVPVAPPGMTQPPGIITPPDHSASADDPVHTAAAALVQYLKQHGCTQNAFAACSNFQGLFNAVSSTKLGTDGKYGGKTQAALQSVITPAVAPPNCFPESGATAAVPANPAPAPNPNVDAFTAASALVAMGSIPAKPLAAVSTFQHAYNAHNPVQHLTEDGKYGPMGQAALQSVINAMGSAQKAPKNLYGKEPKEVPAWPG